MCTEMHVNAYAIEFVNMDNIIITGCYTEKEKQHAHNTHHKSITEK